jgi:hypothetical protein
MLPNFLKLERIIHVDLLEVPNNPVQGSADGSVPMERYMQHIPSVYWEYFSDG